ncbi:hypothetical protein [Stenotrophomonas sp. MMGLT7]|uniref:hypothetical protein n=1 Tax=Stenotrophomonas sp. MMGLT7 TaxID=2901227 RepID=UPI001E60143C|nr:hypothetical protein [Stenotrophomonas sp. MMGLT7]MCD7096915.1 hypothetical protein [Stenotrophomonas sp. MMGLT7]
MNTFPLENPTALIPLPSAEARELAAEIRGLRQALHAVAGDTVSSYGRIDGLIVEKQEQLVALYHAHCAGLSPGEVLAQINARG